MVQAKGSITKQSNVGIVGNSAVTAGKWGQPPADHPSTLRSFLACTRAVGQPAKPLHPTQIRTAGSNATTVVIGK